jgi:hypothetical protein
MKSIFTIIVFVLTYNIYAQEPIGKTQVIAKTPALKCVSGDCVNGWGKWEFNNGYYEGFWENGKKSGYGLYKWDEFGIYVGFWLNDTMEGYGSYEDENGKVIAGMYSNGKLNGFGEESTKDNIYNRGIYKDHTLVTPYDFYTNENEVGCTAGNCENSYGRYEWDNGDIFTGFFKNSIPHLGIYEFYDGNIYNGMFNASGQFHGQGRFFYADKSGYYGGEFSNGNFNGKGYYHDKDYNTKIGVWENGKLVKQL